MARVYNFSAGPAMLPTEVLTRARDEMVDYQGTGMSVMEMSHRGKHFVGIAEQAEANLRKLMNIPDNYKVLFLQGGASTQFGAIPLNLGNGSGKADYLNTGHWSVKAIKEAKRFVDVNVVADTKPENFTTLPAEGETTFSPDADYVHYTPNETIAGVEFPYIPDTGDVPLVADMSSTILSRPIDVSKFGVIYAGAQKNIGPAGLTIVIVREDLLGKSRENTPAMLDWRPRRKPTPCTTPRRPTPGTWPVWSSSTCSPRAVSRKWARSTSARPRSSTPPSTATTSTATRSSRPIAPG